MPFNVGGTTVITDDRIVRLSNGATASRPASPTTGQLWYNTTTAVLEVWNGSAWRPAGTVGSGDVPRLWSWGAGGNGRLGDNTITNKSSPVSAVGGFTNWVRVASGNSNSVALRANGTAWAWGYNYRGQLGDNTRTQRSSPVSVVGGFTDWTDITAANSATIGLRANGTIWTWGAGDNGVLGDGTATEKSSPVAIVGGFTDWIQIASFGTSSHVLGLRANGTAWAWGRNNTGQLGDGTITNRSSPVSVFGGYNIWLQIASGNSHSVALRFNGTIWTWGTNGSGELGDGTTTAKSSPVAIVGGFTDWIQIASGNSHCVGIRANGTAWAWGAGSGGRLGDTQATNRSSPVSVVGGFTDWVRVSAADHTLGIRSNGTLWAWGANNTGQLGDTTTLSRMSPVSVVGGFTDWIEISAGNQHNVALRV